MVLVKSRDEDYIMNSAVSTESIDMPDEDMSQVDGCGLSGASDDEDECASSPAGSAYDDGGDIMKTALSDEVTKQLAAAGPVGMAAAAAIASSKKRKRPHSFETNPSVRKRHQNRLLRKLRQTIEEFATRVGQQAVVLVATPGKPNTSYRVFGAKPLEDVVRNLRCMIMEELENALAQQAPPPPQDDPSLFELPPLIIDGIPTPVEKMTQAQLRAFIPLMLKYSMVRGKPGWGRESTRPPWWPKDLPWANVRMDARSEDEKQKMSWTHALRQIVINCYKYHGREDLLPAFTEDDDQKPTQPISACMPSASSNSSRGSPGRSGPAVLSSQQVCIDQMTLTDVDMSQYAPAVLQTITNPDGSVSLVQIDPSHPIITLPDGTTAQVIHSGEGGASGVVQTLDGESVAVDLNAVAEATLNHDGQIILTGEDGHGYPVSVSGVITVPVSASVYQSMVASMQQQDGVCVAPLVQTWSIEGSGDDTTLVKLNQNVEQNGEGLEALGMGGGVAQVMLQGGDAQVLQVLSLKDATVLTKAMQQVKAERDAVVADS
ncbi:DNA-binding protein Ewg isoform X2 [Leguminivora glycinivorella]|uniref:DNA-binding protein Ewg isoform X2 n=1 Tax=Leguminivora glycinivorella TaxID=1035111 RepID=UPI00200FAC79|nr:DNA-binding protein Ewg isoform X2 [Leguminivora glycinivorella]